MPGTWNTTCVVFDTGVTDAVASAGCATPAESPELDVSAGFLSPEHPAIAAAKPRLNKIENLFMG